MVINSNCLEITIDIKLIAPVLHSITSFNIPGGDFTVTKSSWLDEGLTITLTIAASSVTEDKDFTCVVSAPEQADQKEIGKLNTYSNFCDHCYIISIVSCKNYYDFHLFIMILNF